MHNNWKSFISDIQGDIRRLDSVVRYNSIPVLQRESVATHTFWVTLYSILIHKELSPNEHSKIHERDLMLAALTHDMAECITGDVVRTFKYSSEVLKNAIDEAENAMVHKYFPQAIKSIIQESEEFLSQESNKYYKSVIKAADFASLFMFMNREWIRGNREILPFIDRMVDDLKGLSTKSMAGDWYDVKLSSLYTLMAELAKEIPETRPV